MSLIIPYSQIASTNLVPVTAANFPALKHMFLCNEATNSSSPTMTDSIGGVVVSGATALVNNGDGTLTLTGGMTTPSGAWAVPSTKKILMICSGKPAASGQLLRLGQTGATTTFQGFGVTAGTGTCRYNDGVAAFVATAARTGNSAAATYALSIDPGSATGLISYDFDGTTFNSKTPVSLATATTLSAVDANCAITATANPSFLTVWYFTALPTASEIQAAICWQHAYAFTTKMVYPGFKGRT